MQSEYAQSFEREMACTQAEWLRWLPAAIGESTLHIGPGTASVGIGGGMLHLHWKEAPPRVIALVRLPRLHVSFRFEGLSAEQRLAFMRRFDLHMQRGGG
ncbi:MAG TPA: hypothetical protein VKD22_03440 [Ramlibacter sp.]|nr:hypothetical protein [Ramlibacter sp.]